MPAKPKLTVEQWAEIQAKRLRQAMTYRALAAEYGVSNVAIVKRAKREGWADPAKRPPKPQGKTVDAHRDAYRDGYRDGFRDGLRETMNLRNLAPETLTGWLPSGDPSGLQRGDSPGASEPSVINC